LARRSGKIAVGATAVRNEIRRQRALLLIFASDFSTSARERLLAGAASKPPVLETGTMQEWGDFFGRDRVGVVAVTDVHFVTGIMQKIKPVESGFTEKFQLRNQMRIFRRQLNPARRKAMSERVISRLESLPVFRRARSIHTYVSFGDEVDTHALIHRLLREGRQVAAPRIEGASGELHHFFIRDFSQLQPGRFGILEPAPNPRTIAMPETFDMVLVPGLAFDREGNRLGLGKGYYDRFLAKVHAPKIALAFAFQMMKKISTEPHDQRVDMVITEKEVIDCAKAKLG
jgi:5-formyltetrahydrofolate cyclo-ligase